MCLNNFLLNLHLKKNCYGFEPHQSTTHPPPHLLSSDISQLLHLSCKTDFSLGSPKAGLQEIRLKPIWKTWANCIWFLPNQFYNSVSIGWEFKLKWPSTGVINKHYQWLKRPNWKIWFFGSSPTQDEIELRFWGSWYRDLKEDISQIQSQFSRPSRYSYIKKLLIFPQIWFFKFCYWKKKMGSEGG